MTKKITVLIFIALMLTQLNCASRGFSKQIENIIEEQKLSSSELKELIDKKDTGYILIDVRSESEYNSGYIPTAINVPYTRIHEQSEEIPKDKLIIVYCKFGERAETARKKLIELGYENVINFGGTNSWEYELVK
ncbi:rhodanese-like domain-containing protein [candidate division WOR-3 bacterium]|nr:rhodanese-like domain-containing protein [candidate division WOR-3 bacterium]